MAGVGSDFVRFRYDFVNALLLAVESIRGHKLRSFLTLLGIIIGVASVILVGAAIEGLGVYAEQSTAKAFGWKSFLVAQIAAAGRLSRREFFDKIKRNKTDPAGGRACTWRPSTATPFSTAPTGSTLRT